MIINFKLIRLLFIISFFLFFPFIQKQWYNLYLFNTNNFSFYSFLYYCSGLLIPILVGLSSTKYFTLYKFNFKDINISFKKKFRGKGLFILVLLTLISLSSLLANYFYINIELIANLIFKKKFFIQINFALQVYSIIFLSILLIFRKSRIIIKELILANFFIISLILWYSELNNIIISDKLLINKYLTLENINYTNIIFLITIEIIYFLWSYISYENNMSDWTVPFPNKNNFIFIPRIIFFYSFIILYYSIIN